MKKRPLLLCLLLIAVFCCALGQAFITQPDHESLTKLTGENWSESFSLAQFSYLNWNPRIGELLYFFCHGIMAVQMAVHPLAIVLGLLFLFRIGTGKWPDGSVPSLMGLVFVLFALYGFHSNIYWFLANFNWLYPAVASMGLVILVEKWFEGSFRLPAWRVLCAIPLAAIAGMSQENTPLALIVLFGSCAFYWRVIKKQGLPSWQYVTIMGVLFCAACAFYLAPGTYHRAEQSLWEFSFQNLLYGSLLNPSCWIYFFICFWRPFLVIGLLLLLARKKGWPLLKERRSLLLIAAFALLWLPLLCSPWWGGTQKLLALGSLPCRAFMPPVPLLIIPGGGIRQSLCFLSLEMLIMLTFIIPAFASYYSAWGVWKQIARHAEQAKARGETSLTLTHRDLDLSPGWDIPHVIPNFVMEHRSLPYIPLVPISKNDYERYYSENSSCAPEISKRADNKLQAKRLGMESIFFLSGK